MKARIKVQPQSTLVVPSVAGCGLQLGSELSRCQSKEGNQPDPKMASASAHFPGTLQDNRVGRRVLALWAFLGLGFKIKDKERRESTWEQMEQWTGGPLCPQS